MEKRLQDYAQYYIGCRCFNTWFPESDENYNNNWKLVGFRSDSEKPYGLENDEDYTWSDSIKLILRKLEDITEEEKKNLHIGRCFDFQCYRADQFNELLAKGFDLFGLINSGLAIDAATLQRDSLSKNKGE
jgi:hypothetical protein